MDINELRKKIKLIIDNSGKAITKDYNDFRNEHNDMNSLVGATSLGKMVSYRVICESILDCLNENSDNYNCFLNIKPILDVLKADKTLCLDTYGFLLSKALKIETDYSIMMNYLEITEEKNLGKTVDDVNNIVYEYLDNVPSDVLKSGVFLKDIITPEGNFLPHILNNYERFMLIAMGLSYEQVCLIGKHCRSLYKKENKIEDLDIKGTRIITVDSVNKEINNNKLLFESLKSTIDFDNYDIICERIITETEKCDLLNKLRHLDFNEDKIHLIKSRIEKNNKRLMDIQLSNKIEMTKKMFFDNQMFMEYDNAREIINNDSFIYKDLKNEIINKKSYIDRIIMDYIEEKESKEDTMEYLIMAFEDLDYSLSICPQPRKRVNYE